MEGLKFQEVIDEIRDLVRGSWRYRWEAVIVAWLVCLVAWSFVLLMPDVYRASSQLRVEEDDDWPKLPGMANQNEVLEDVNVMLKSVMSRPTLEEIARRSGYDLGNPDPAEVDALSRRLGDSLEIGLDKNQVLEIAIEHSNREVAYAVVDVLIEMFVEGMFDSEADGSGTAKDFLTKKVEEYELLLAESEARLAEFKKKNLGMMPGESGGYFARLEQEMRDLTELDAAISLARQRRAALERQMAGEEPTLGLMGDSRQALSSPQIVALEAELVQLRLLYTNEHPDVLRTQQLIDELRAELAARQPQRAISTSTAERNPVYQQMRMQFNQADLELMQLESQRGQQARTVADLKTKIDTIPEIEAELTRLNRSYDVYRAKYTEFVEQRETAKLSIEVQRSRPGLNFTMIDPPSVGTNPVGPNRKLFVTLGLIVALGLGVALAGVRSLATPVLYSAGRLERMFGVRVIGAIKLVKSPQELSRQRLGTIMVSLSLLALVGVFGAVVVLDRTGAELASRVAGMIG